MAPKAAAGGSGFAAARAQMAATAKSVATKKPANTASKRTYDDDLADASFSEPIPIDESEEPPIADTRVILSCCQPLALANNPTTGEQSTAYIDTEGALLTTSGARFGQSFDEILSSFRYDDLGPLHFHAHQAITAFDDVSEYDTAFSAVSDLFSQINKNLLKLKPRLTELSPLLFGGTASSKSEQLIAAIVSELVEALKGEKEESIAIACEQFRQGVASVKAWAAKSAKGGGVASAQAANKAKVEGAERLASVLVNVAHDLAVSKSGQGAILRGRYRVPRYDAGQRIRVIDTSSHPHCWRDGTVLQGGPMLCEIDGEQRVLSWGSRAEEHTAVAGGGGADEVEVEGFGVYPKHVAVVIADWLEVSDKIVGDS